MWHKNRWCSTPPPTTLPHTYKHTNTRVVEVFPIVRKNGQEGRSAVTRYTGLGYPLYISGFGKGKIGSTVKTVRNTSQSHMVRAKTKVLTKLYTRDRVRLCNYKNVAGTKTSWTQNQSSVPEGRQTWTRSIASFWVDKAEHQDRGACRALAPSPSIWHKTLILPWNKIHDKNFRRGSEGNRHVR